VGHRVTIIEDEADIVEMVAYNLRKEGFEVQGFARGLDGLERVRDSPPDLLLLDIMLPDADGLDICRRLRSDERLQTLPIIFLTAKSEEVDRIVGLELGADDYVVKPFSPRGLLARIKAVLRRGERVAETTGAIAIRDLRLDPQTQDVVVRGTRIELTALEFKLLYFLASHPRLIFSRERLLDAVWGDDRSVTPRTVDVHIRRLREKIESQPDNPKYIGTVRGAGYRFLSEPPGMA